MGNLAPTAEPPGPSDTGFVSLLESLLRHATDTPDRLAYVAPGERITYADLARRIAGGAAALQALGVRAGDCLALDIVDEADAVTFLAAQYAAAWLGACVLPLYPDLPAARRREVCDHIAPRWLLSAQPDRRPGVLPLAALAAATVSASPPPRCDTAERPYQYLLSSGTTGAPKAARFTAVQIAQMNRITAAMEDMLSTDRVLPAKAWPSGVGMRWARRVLDCGATFCNFPFPRSWREFVELVATQGITGASASPWQVRAWLTDATGAPLAALRFLELAGAPTHAHEIAAIRRHITPNLVIIYGSNEAGILGWLAPTDAPDAPLRLAPELQAQAFDAAGSALPSGQAGRLGFRAPWIATEYANNPQASARQFCDGWCFPGDYGVVDGVGGMQLLGRSDDLINQGGNKIVPEEIEALLLADPNVRDAAVVGIVDPLSGERAVACVVLRVGARIEAIHTALAQRISVYALPTRFVALRAIPRNSDGKVDRQALRRGLEQRAGHGSPGKE